MTLPPLTPCPRCGMTVWSLIDGAWVCTSCGAPAPAAPRAAACCPDCGYAGGVHAHHCRSLKV